MFPFASIRIHLRLSALPKPIFARIPLPSNAKMPDDDIQPLALSVLGRAD